MQIILFFIFFSESGGGKKGAKKKGSSFQTVSALFRVQYILEFQGLLLSKKLNYHNKKNQEIYNETEKNSDILKK